MSKKQVTTRGYETYVKSYQDKVNSLIKRGISTKYVDPIMNFEDWKYTYNATRNTLVEKVQQGSRKVVGNVNQYIVSKQMYVYTAKQAAAIKVASNKLGYNLSVAQIRSGEFDWTPIKEYQAELRAKGVRPKDINTLVAEYFFGSD